MGIHASSIIDIIIVTCIIIAAIQISNIRTFISDQRRLAAHNARAVEESTCVIPRNALKSYTIEVDKDLMSIMKAVHGQTTFADWTATIRRDVVRINKEDGSAATIGVQYKDIDIVFAKGMFGLGKLKSDVISGACKYVIFNGQTFAIMTPDAGWHRKLNSDMKTHHSNVLRNAADTIFIFGMASFHPQNILGIPPGASLATPIALGTPLDRTILNRSFHDMLANGVQSVALIGYGLP